MNSEKVLSFFKEITKKYEDTIEKYKLEQFIVQKQIKLLEELLEKKMNEYFG